MEILDLPLPGLKLVRPTVHRDERGFFLESWARGAADAGGLGVFVQDNHSRSIAGTLRGLHYQRVPGQAKLVRVARGAVFDVTVDLRPDSPTFGQWYGRRLDDVEHEQLFVPVGFAHGFYTLTDWADVAYKVSTPYVGATEATLAWDDPDLAVAWPLSGPPRLSSRDAAAPSFESYRKAVGR